MADFGTHLSKLQMLKLSKNEITTLVDEAFSKLTRLSQLDLSYNRLRVSLRIFKFQSPTTCCMLHATRVGQTRVSVGSTV